MKVKHLVASLFVLFLGIALTGCAGLTTKNTAGLTCTSKDIGAMLKSGAYQKKTDNFLVILDDSSSMGEKLGQILTDEPSKLTLAKDLITCMNNTLPADFDVNSGMRVFGPGSSDQPLAYGMTKYSKAGLGNAVMGVSGVAGVTPLGKAIAQGSKDIADLAGDIAVIIFSDGVNTAAGNPVDAVNMMKDTYGDRVCVYTVLVGDDPQGKMTLEQVAAAGKCGFATEADNLAYRVMSDGLSIGVTDGMADFVTAVFLKKAVMKVDVDSDGDGVVDRLDKCPDTPQGIKVDSVGCPVPIPEKVTITLLVEFDFDKAVVKPQYHNDLEKVANFMKAYPKTTAQLEGHTDSVGTDAYNMKLSERRAESVKNYLVEKFGIDGSRLSTVGYGETKPVATNDTDEGRQMNRRVVTNIVTVIMK